MFQKCTFKIKEGESRLTYAMQPPCFPPHMTPIARYKSAGLQEGTFCFYHVVPALMILTDASLT